MIRLLTLALVAAMTGSVSAQKQQTLHSGYPIDTGSFHFSEGDGQFLGTTPEGKPRGNHPVGFQ